MEPIIERAAGIDVHQKTAVACALVGDADHRPKKEVKTFGTTLSDLVELRAWLAAFHILADGTVYEDLGAGYLDGLSKARTSKHLVRRLEALGFRVAIEPTAA